MFTATACYQALATDERRCRPTAAVLQPLINKLAAVTTLGHYGRQ